MTVCCSDLVQLTLRTGIGPGQTLANGTSAVCEQGTGSRPVDAFEDAQGGCHRLACGRAATRSPRRVTADVSSFVREMPPVMTDEERIARDLMETLTSERNRNRVTANRKDRTFRSRLDDGARPAHYTLGWPRGQMGAGVLYPRELMNDCPQPTKSRSEDTPHMLSKCK